MTTKNHKNASRWPHFAIISKNVWNFFLRFLIKWFAMIPYEHQSVNLTRFWPNFWEIWGHCHLPMCRQRQFHHPNISSHLTFHKISANHRQANYNPRKNLFGLVQWSSKLTTVRVQYKPMPRPDFQSIISPK